MQGLMSGGGGGSDIVVKLLWSNPTAATQETYFAAQTLSLDLSNYDGVLIHCFPEYGYTSTHKSSYCPTYTHIYKGESKYANDRYGYQRLATVSATGIVFGDGYWGGNNPNYNNNYCIPYQIYGVKSIKEN